MAKGKGRGRAAVVVGKDEVRPAGPGESSAEAPATPAEALDGLPGIRRLEWRTPEELADNPANWKDHGEHQVAAQEAQLDVVGWSGAALFNEVTGRLIDGHMRKGIAAKRGDRIPVLIGRWTPEQETLLLATLDPIGQMADPNGEKLAAVLEGIGEQADALAPVLERLGEQAAEVTLNDLAALEEASGAGDAPEAAGSDAGEGADASTDYKSFTVMLSATQERTVREAVRVYKAKHGVETTPEALTLIAQEWLNANEE